MLPLPDGKKVVQRDVGKRWTPALANTGWTPVSDFFLDNFHRLTPPITHGEAMLIILLVRHKWDDAPPFPGFKSLSNRLGVSMTAARHLARRLEQKGFLRREKQKGETNRFHLQPLFSALERLQSGINGDQELNSSQLLSKFMGMWIDFEQVAGVTARNLAPHYDKTQLQRTPMLAISMLAGLGILDQSVYEEIDTIRRIRDSVEHGSIDFKKHITSDLILRLKALTDQIEKVGQMSEREKYERLQPFMTGSFGPTPKPRTVPLFPDESDK